MALLKVQPGDVIGVPAAKNGEWGFVMARVIRDDVVTLIEVFSDFYTNFAISEKEVLQKNFCINNRLFNPVNASFDFNRYFGKIKWPVLAKTPGFDPEQSKISEIEFEGTLYD